MANRVKKNDLLSNESSPLKQLLVATSEWDLFSVRFWVENTISETFVHPATRAEHVRFVTVGSKLPLSGSTNMRGIWGTPLYTQNPPGGSRVLKGGEYGPIGGVCSPP